MKQDVTLRLYRGKVKAIEVNPRALFWMVQKFIKLELLKKAGKFTATERNYTLDLKAAIYYDIFERGIYCTELGDDLGDYCERDIKFEEWWERAIKGQLLITTQLTGDSVILPLNLPATATNCKKQR